MLIRFNGTFRFAHQVKSYFVSLHFSFPASPKNVEKFSVDMNLSLETGSSKIVPPNKMQIAVTTSPTKSNSTQQTRVPLEMNKVGQSVFYDCLDLSPMAEKQDDMKPERSDTEEDSK